MAGRPVGYPKSGGGSRKGIPNKSTHDVREAILWAADQLGGKQRIVTWAQEDPQNERIFWDRLYPRLLPKEINANVAGTVQVKLIDEF